MQELAADEKAMSTIVNLTSAFEGIASMRISQVKSQVLASQAFFEELWQIYRQLRVDSLFRFGRDQQEDGTNDPTKELFIVITAEGGFSGDIDQKLISWMLESYDEKKHDILMIGHHGAIQLAQLNIPVKKYYKLPEKEQNINVQPLVHDVRSYKNTTVYYQAYVSLMVQDVKRIELSKAVQEAGKKVAEGEETISDKNYIFEPSTFSVVAHIERSMLDITLSQLILDSKLAQYASRFRAMSGANERSSESLKDLHLVYNRTKRAISDERLKQTLVSHGKAMQL